MNQKEFARQQQAAVDRMWEMNSRSKPSSGNTPKSPPRQNVNNPKPNPTQQNNSLFGNMQLPFLDKITKDSDTALIIGLLLILMSENADKRLLFALVYILL